MKDHITKLGVLLNNTTTDYLLDDFKINKSVMNGDDAMNIIISAYFNSMFSLMNELADTEEAIKKVKNFTKTILKAINDIGHLSVEIQKRTQK